MAGMDDLDAGGRLVQGIEQMIVVHAGQGVERLDPVGEERSDRGLRRRHRLRHRLCHCAVHSVSLGEAIVQIGTCADQARAVEGVPIARCVG